MSSRLTCRMPSHRFMLLGGRDSGKSSLVKSLTSGVSQLCRTPTEGVEVTEWRPSEQFVGSEVMKGMNIEEPDQIVIEMWDMTGRMCCWSIHQEYFSYSTVYIVTFNWLRQTSIDAAMTQLKLIQQKVPGSQVILISTHAASIGYGKDLESVKQDIKSEIELLETAQTNVIIDQLSNVQEYSDISYAVKEKQNLEDLLTKTLTVHTDILEIDMEHGKGLEECTRTILKVGLGRPGSRLLNRSLLPPITNPLPLMVKLAELRKRHKLVVSKASADLNIAQDILTLLSSAGLIMQYETPALDEKNHVCIDPKQLAHATCLFHFDDLTKNFKFEAYRFWPKDSGYNRPDPSVLVRALEEIPSSGVIREALFPLLWQDKQYSEEQIKLIISILTERNLIYKESRSNTQEPASAENYDIHHVKDKDLFLPNYPGLSPTTKYYLPLLGSLSDIKPGVNWSEELFEDDIHFGLVFTLQNQEVTESLVKKMLVSCNECSQGQSYKYLWNRGCLCKYNDEVTTNVYYDDDQRCIYASARGPYEEDNELLKIMWMTLKPACNCITSALSEYPGIVYSVEIEARGAPLLTKLSAGRKRKSLRYPFWECAHIYQSGQLTLQASDMQLNLDMIFHPIKDDFFGDGSSGTWCKALLPHSCLDDFLIIQKPAGHESTTDSETRQRPSKRAKGNISWKSQISEVIDMEKKRQVEESKPRVIPDTVMRKQIRRIAHSLVTSVITSAIVTVLVSKGKITQQQEPMVELVAGAVTAGHRGDTILAVESINKAIKLIHQHTEKDEPRKSKVCVIL